MARVPNQDDQGLAQVVFALFTKKMQRWWHRRRKPKFGMGTPIESSVSEHIPSAQIRMSFDGQAEVDTAVVGDPPMPVEPRVVAVPSKAAVRVLISTPGTWKIPSLTRTFVTDELSWALGLVILLVIGVRVWKYNTLQSEMYGDIEIVQTYTRNILAGNWPWYFTLSSGPLYHYLIAPILYLLGEGYDQIKIASITVSFIILGYVYGFAKRFEGRLYALFALAFAGTGSWLLIFSRLGNSQLFVPLVTISTVYFLYRYIQTQDVRWLYASALAATCGLYSYPQSFVVAPVMWLTVIALRFTGIIKHRSELIKYTIALAVGSIPFIWMYMSDPSQVSGDYITEKIAGGDNLIGNIPVILLRGIGAYFTNGDDGFRGNASGLPHIDMVSTGLLIVGVLALFRKSRQSIAPLFLIPLVLLHVPSLLVLRYPEQVPSASRSIGAAPFVYLIVALGLFELYLFVKARVPKVAEFVVALLLIISVQSNIDRYFVKYIAGMPYNDVPIGRELVRFVDSLSHDTTVYVAGCCWRDVSPEPFFSQIQLSKPERLQRFDPVETLTCESLAAVPRPAVIVWSFDNSLPSPGVRGCADEFKPMLHATKAGVPLFYSAALTGIANPNYVDPASDGSEQSQGDISPPPAEPAVDELPAPPAIPATSVTEVLSVNGVQTTVTASTIDTGSFPDLFDGNPDSLIRGSNQNPFDVTLDFATPTQTKKLTFKLAGMHNFVAIIKVTDAAGTESYEQTFPTADSDQVVVFDLPKAVEMTKLQVSFFEQDVPADVATYIHVREINIGNE